MVWAQVVRAWNQPGFKASKVRHLTWSMRLEPSYVANACSVTAGPHILVGRRSRAAEGRSKNTKEEREGGAKTCHESGKESRQKGR
jgi:hypothetical protein